MQHSPADGSSSMQNTAGARVGPDASEQMESNSVLWLQDLEAEWVGKTVPCIIEQVEPQNNKIIGNIRHARVIKSARSMQARRTCWHAAAQLWGTLCQSSCTCNNRISGSIRRVWVLNAC